MQKLTSLLLLTLFVMGTTACSKQYFISNDFKQQTKTHQLVAIAPVEMIFTGTPLGSSVSEKDVIALEEGESKAFQTSLFNQLQFETSDNRKPIRIELQSPAKSNRMLEKKGISIRDSWEMTPEELATTLGVDAVIQTKVYKTQYLSDLASFGIDIGKKVIGVLSGGKSIFVTGGQKLEKTNDIRATCHLLNGKDGESLWSMQLEDATDWQQPTPEIIDRINRRFANNFPYRNKRK